MGQKLTQATINQKVWKACDTFRGTIDATQYKDYILTMLFLKYITDVNKEKRQAYMEKYNGDHSRVERAMAHERFQVPANSSFDYLYQNRNADNLGELINIALENIEDANRSKLEKVFRNIDYNSEPNLGQTKDRNRRLKNLLGDFEGLDLRPSNLQGNDVIGDAYEYLIANFASDAGKKAGEFYTPAQVSTLLAKLVEPESGDRVCDPTCGSGSLLLKVADEVGSKNISLNGQEINGSTWALARMNMFLHEMDNAHIEWGDTLNNPKLKENDALMKFDIVVANPPFSLDKWGAEDATSDRYNRFHRGVPPKSKGDYAFLTHMIETLNEHGRAGVVLPHGVLFRGSSEGKIRKQFMKENLLKAVIGLPANLFFGTGIPACILVFDKNKGENTEVLFIDASNEYESGKNQNQLTHEHIQKIYDTYSNWDTIDKYSYVASQEEIEENDYNLNIPRYVDTFEEEEPVDIQATQKKITKLKSELSSLETQLDSHLKTLGLL
ncbi:type I restriction-modification system subunit M [Zeaxanthinibacter sp. PT1]|uniref:type I restriction-modification system subunit M n=1 Tax=Zeaxanthinibacter TaxID=561554 RepID=UPI00234B38BD|nr:type I restriction-modification system subunit M [Zeaxanthinibacter sp. PT1]MDC6350474.1 type I restriction-modification system subunit M [Zeaxanthinibacter sp. PT1]